MDEPNREFLTALADAPESHMDPRMGDMIRKLIDQPTHDVKQGLREALDYGARYALCSDFIMNVIRVEWERLGGKNSDPAPWRDEIEAREKF